MILKNPSKFNYDIANDDAPDLYIYMFDLVKLEKNSSYYSESVWESLKIALKDFAPDQTPNFVIFCGDEFYDGLPVSYQIGILGEIETTMHVSLMREFEKIDAFCEFDIFYSESLIAKYRFYKNKVFVYNNDEGKSYTDYNIGREVFPRYLFHEDWMRYHGIK